MPETVVVETKPQIALAQIKAARAARLPEGVALMDAGYRTMPAASTSLPRDPAR